MGSKHVVTGADPEIYKGGDGYGPMTCIKIFSRVMCMKMGKFACNVALQAKQAYANANLEVPRTSKQFDICTCAVLATVEQKRLESSTGSSP